MDISVFFFNDTATAEIYTLSLHDALPIWPTQNAEKTERNRGRGGGIPSSMTACQAIARATTERRLSAIAARSEEHTSELQSRQYLVCRLLLEKIRHLTAGTLTLVTSCSAF